MKIAIKQQDTIKSEKVDYDWAGDSDSTDENGTVAYTDCLATVKIVLPICMFPWIINLIIYLNRYHNLVQNH